MREYHVQFCESPWGKFLRATHLVIMVQNKSDLNFVENLVRGWLRAGGLKLKESKTRWIDMSNWSRSHQSKFKFLGFKFHLRSYKDNPERFWIARQPSEESRKSLRESLRERLHIGLSLQEAYDRLEETWRGWSEYFRYGNSNRIFYRERKQAKKILIFPRKSGHENYAANAIFSYCSGLI